MTDNFKNKLIFFALFFLLGIFCSSICHSQIFKSRSDNLIKPSKDRYSNKSSKTIKLKNSKSTQVAFFRVSRRDTIIYDIYVPLNKYVNRFNKTSKKEDEIKKKSIEESDTLMLDINYKVLSSFFKKGNVKIVDKKSNINIIEIEKDYCRWFDGSINYRGVKYINMNNGETIIRFTDKILNYVSPL